MSWGAVAGAAVGGLGDLLTGGYFSRKAWLRQKEAMQNQHQWEVADLRAAGLNPILSATGGSGASTGGLTGSMVSDTSQVSRAVANAFQGSQLTNILNQQKAGIEKTNAETSAFSANARVADQQAKLIRAQTETVDRENKFYSDNPNVYEIDRANKAWPYVGGAAAVGNQIFNDVKSGVSSSAKAVKESVERASRNFNSKFTGHKYTPQQIKRAKEIGDKILQELY